MTIDPMRLLHTMLRVGNLQRSIHFYTNVLGMKLLRTSENPEYKYSLAFLGFESNPAQAEIELTYNWGVEQYEMGTAYGHIALGVADVAAACEKIKAAGGNVTRAAGPVAGGTTGAGAASCGSTGTDVGAAGACTGALGTDDGLGSSPAGAAGAAGSCDITPRFCSVVGRALCVAYHAMNRLIPKKVIASHLVALVRKLDAPREPNTVADAPAPKPEPAAAPAPRCIRMSTIIATATRT